MFFPISVCLCSAIITGCISTWLVRKCMRRWNVLDIPNQRSAHKIPIPTLGGLGIIVGFWSGQLTWFLYFGQIHFYYTGLFAINILILCFIFDDVVRPFNIFEKIVLQIVIVGCCLHFGFVFESVTVPYVGHFELDWMSWPVTMIWIFCISNIYNFMDGIDGITGYSTIATGIGVLSIGHQVGGELSALILGLCGAVAGFLVFNTSPATIFMGDVGSFFVGIFVAIAGILWENSGFPLWVFCMFLSYYIFDVLYTTIRRAAIGENITVAHQKHLYQRLSTLGWGHFWICIWVIFVTSLCGAGGICLWRDVTAWGTVLLNSGIILLLGTVWWVELKMPRFWFADDA